MAFPDETNINSAETRFRIGIGRGWVDKLFQARLKPVIQSVYPESGAYCSRGFIGTAFELISGDAFL